MNWLRKLFSGGGDLKPPRIDLDVAERTTQLRRLESALDQLVAAMKAQDELMANPGWKERVAEYQRVSGTAMRLRGSGFTRAEQIGRA